MLSAEPKKPPVETPTPKPSTEVVYVQDRKVKSKKEREITPAASQKNNKKPKLISEMDRESQLSKKETNSSVSSPMSAPDSVITLPDSLENSADVPEKDPLADSELDEKPPPKPVNLSSLSFDYNSSSTPPPMPVIPSRRVLRKRGREASPEPAKVIVNESKKMKMKGKRQINATLRKSVEEKKEQQTSSSDEVQVVVPTKPSKKTPKKKQKKSKKQPQRKPMKTKNDSIEVSDDDSVEHDNEDTKKKSIQETKTKKISNEPVDLSDDNSNSTPKPKPKGKNSE